MAAQGGFALITGDPGLGKSKTLQRIAHQLEQIPDLTVGVMQRPQSALGDFYRELGELFNVGLSPANSYGGFKALRARWQTHCQSTLLRPVLLIDEAQQVSVDCLTELLAVAAERNLPRIDESLFFELFSPTGSKPPRNNHRKK